MRLTSSNAQVRDEIVVVDVVLEPTDLKVIAGPVVVVAVDVGALVWRLTLERSDLLTIASALLSEAGP